jgi:hypothetical protein
MTANPVILLVGRIAVGEYCLATKFSDGEAWDNYAVGFYAGEIFPGRHQVVDHDGKPFRAGGFRRCEPITREQGDFILFTPGISDTDFRLWDYIHPSNSIVSPQNCGLTTDIQDKAAT